MSLWEQRGNDMLFTDDHGEVWRISPNGGDPHTPVTVALENDRASRLELGIQAWMQIHRDTLPAEALEQLIDMVGDPGTTQCDFPKCTKGTCRFPACLMGVPRR